MCAQGARVMRASRVKVEVQIRTQTRGCGGVKGPTLAGTINGAADTKRAC